MGIWFWASIWATWAEHDQVTPDMAMYPWWCSLVRFCYVKTARILKGKECFQLPSLCSCHLSIMRSCRRLAAVWRQNSFEISLICNTNGLVMQNLQLYKCGWEICLCSLGTSTFFLTFSVLPQCFQEESWRGLSWSYSYECKLRIIWRQSCSGFLPAFLPSELHFQKGSQEGKSQQFFFLLSDAAWGGEV